MMRTKPVLIFSGLLIIVAIFMNLGIDKATHGISKNIKGPSIKGVCWVAGDSIAEHNFSQIAEIGSNWISQTPFGWMDGHQSSEVRGNFDKAWWGETDRGIQYTSSLARQHGIKSMLKPHIWMPTNKGKWRSEIEMSSEVEWDKWFESYGSWMLHYAELAEVCQIEALCIGTELHSTTVGQPDRWRKLIRDIRKVYSGDITYAANWYREFEEIEFWDQLDYIGIQAYFPLTQENAPSKNELIESWENHKEGLKRISEKFDKKIVFTEIGYKNTVDAAKEPWTWPQQMDKSVSISDDIQKICYQALFESVWHESWFDGLFIWKWFHSTYKHTDYKDYFGERHKRRQERAKRQGRHIGPHVHFSPQYGDALEILKQWYKGEPSN